VSELPGQVPSLSRVEVYLATGMVMAPLGVGPAESNRAAAFASGLTATGVAWSIVGRQLSLESDDERPGAGRVGGAA
jgi:hypothetical protein